MRKRGAKHLEVVKLGRGRKRRLPRFGKEVLILLSLLLLVATWRIFLHEMLHVKTPSSVLMSEWRRYSPGSSQLSLMLPAEPQSQSAEVPESADEAISRVNRCGLAVGPFKVDMWDISYKEGLPTSIEQAASGAVEALRQSEEVTEYQDTKTPIDRSGRKGVLVKGRFKRRGEKMELEAVLIGDGPKLWQVIIIHPASDRNGVIASQRILNSIEIN
ncbi:MAG TPA: hypothetical protein VJ464_10885 [Blastocatellia bacterium]|nr:hypothetical protein [Blastocatellia bacterium]